MNLPFLCGSFALSCLGTASLIYSGNQCFLPPKVKAVFTYLKFNAKLFSYSYLCKQNQGQVSYALKVRQE